MKSNYFLPALALLVLAEIALTAIVLAYAFYFGVPVSQFEAVFLAELIAFLAGALLLSLSQ